MSSADSDPTNEPIQDLRRRIVAWGESEERVRAMLLTGSHARPGDADRLSDLDVALFCDDPAPLDQDDRWLERIAPVWINLPVQDGEGHPARLVIFAGGLKADLGLNPLRSLQELAAATVLPEVYDRGYEVLLDKDGLTAALPPPRRRHHRKPPPSREEFVATVEEFWFEVWHVAKYLARGELWHAKFRDWATKEFLLRIIEWDAQARHGWDHDTRHLGLKLRQWGDPAVWQRLPEVFGHFDAADAWQALAATTCLFGDVARGIAARLGYSYPQQLEDDILAFVANLKGGRSGS